MYHHPVSRHQITKGTFYVRSNAHCDLTTRSRHCSQHSFSVVVSGHEGPSRSEASSDECQYVLHMNLVSALLMQSVLFKSVARLSAVLGVRTRTLEVPKVGSLHEVTST